jgi:hydroxyacylglutathione hydrolase
MDMSAMKSGKVDIKQYRYGIDNFSYLIYDDLQAIAVDGGAVEEILAFLEESGRTLTYVANTHSHGDHTAGNNRLLSRTSALLLENDVLLENKVSLLLQWNIKVYQTPGHSIDSLCFYCGSVLISGDTLFNGTIGNCFSGDMQGFYDSLMHLCTLPPATVIYAGHDYVRESLAFARRLEPANKKIDQYLKKYSPNHVFSTLQDEFQVNPYLRFNEKSIISLLEARSLPVATPFERWNSLMSIA